MDYAYDVIIIGGGVVGSSIARELSKYILNTCVLEKELDVCCETSGRNSGVLHAGFNNKAGSLMAKFCVEGNENFDEIAKELDIPFKRTGKLVVGFNEEDKEKLIKMKEQGEANGVKGLEIINKDKIRKLSPYVEGNFALYSPQTGILNPFIYTIAMAENAVSNGVKYFLDNEVLDIKKVLEKDKDIFQKDIEATFSIRRSTATGLLQCLEGNGFVKRVSVDYDARLKKIVLTTKAHEFKELLESHIQKMEEILVKDLEPQEVDDLIRIIGKIKKNLE